LLDWLTAQVNAPVLRADDPADLAWLEEHDSVGTAVRIGGFSPTAFAGWQRPHSPDAPYLAGLIPEPVEHSLIDHDLHAPEIFGELRDNPGLRSDIHVLVAPDGRRLEIANVNATPVEGRLGTDLIYYHEHTRSFILVQYKRISLTDKTITVDDRLRRQLDRLEAVASLSQAPARPHDWRLGADACFLKLAKWPAAGQLSQELANGMYLPLSYVRLLLEDDCTLGPRGGRVLGYGTVERHVTGAQFIQLIQHGLAGTVGTTVEQLKQFSIQRAEQDRTGVVLAAEHSSETVKQRQQRVNSRSPKKRARTRSR
jgi:hypothetical protein